MASSDSAGWILVLDPPEPSAHPGFPPSFPLDREILGLSVPLRLALTAQATGAGGIALSDAVARLGLRALLADRRIKIPITAEMDRKSLLEYRATSPSVRVPVNLVVFRGTLAWASENLVGETRLLPCGGEPNAPSSRFGFDPILVTDEASAARAKKALMRALRKPQDGWTSTYLNRGISLWLTERLVATRLRPNQVSVAILGVGLLGAYFASRGTYPTMLAGAFLFQAQSVLDGCDGEMSRITFQGSRAGEWLDTVGDDLTNYGFFAGAAWGLYRSTGLPLYLALGAVTVGSGIVGSAIEYRYLIRIGSGDLLKYPIGVGKAAGAGGRRSFLGHMADAISPLFKRDTFVFLTLIGAALGILGPFLAIFAAGAVGVLVAVLLAERRMARAARAEKQKEKDAPPLASGG
jgi:phosphatidylglycerophosphate synthase